MKHLNSIGYDMKERFGEMGVEAGGAVVQTSYGRLGPTD